MEKWRERLRAAIKAQGLDFKAASLKAGLNPTAVSEILRGKEPRAETLIALSAALGISLDEVLMGAEAALNQIGTQPAAVRLAPVVGIVQAGLWYEEASPPQIAEEPIPYVPTRYKNMEQQAFKVQGPSMNLRRIEDGDFVIAVPYWQVRIAPQDNDLVVVERRRDGGEVERTVKEVVVLADRVELWPRSSDPAFTKPITIARNRDSSDFVEVEIVGLVIGRFSPL